MKKLQLNSMVAYITIFLHYYVLVMSNIDFTFKFEKGIIGIGGYNNVDGTS